MKETPPHSLTRSTQSGHPDRSKRAPVPDYIRTQRTAPRIFSFGLLLVWIVGFTVVSPKLSQVKSSAGFWSEPLSLGAHQWLILHKSSPDQCSGLFKLSLSEAQGKIRAVGSGTLDLSFNQPAGKPDQSPRTRSGQSKEKTRLIAIEIDSKFDEAQALDTFEALAETNLGTIRVSWSKEIGQASVTLQRGELPEEQYKFSFAETAQLLVDEQQSLRLQVPQELQQILSSFPLLNGADVRMLSASNEQLTQCAAKLPLATKLGSNVRERAAVEQRTQRSPGAPLPHQPPPSPQEPAI